MYYAYLEKGYTFREIYYVYLENVIHLEKYVLCLFRENVLCLFGKRLYI